MQVSFEHKEVTEGFFKKNIYIEVLATVKFSDDELNIIQNRKLKDFAVWDRPPDYIGVRRDAALVHQIVEAGRYRLTIGKLMKGKPDSYTCASVVHSKNYEQELTAKLKQAKDFIVGNSEVPASKTIEL